MSTTVKLMMAKKLQTCMKQLRIHARCIRKSIRGSGRGNSISHRSNNFVAVIDGDAVVSVKAAHSKVDITHNMAVDLCIDTLPPTFQECLKAGCLL